MTNTDRGCIFTIGDCRCPVVALGNVPPDLEAKVRAAICEEFRIHPSSTSAKFLIYNLNPAGRIGLLFLCRSPK
jgi:hypothetical protein